MEGSPRPQWNDDRLDALSERMDMQFRQVDERMDLQFRRVDERMDLRFGRVDERFVEIEQRLDRFETRVDRFEVRVDGRFDSIEAGLRGVQRTMVAAMTSVVVAVIAQGFLIH
jgi:hypothetical protein